VFLICIKEPIMPLIPKILPLKAINIIAAMPISMPPNKERNGVNSGQLIVMEGIGILKK
jgi:hypothetical protein